jgi:hypothetical protein
VTLCRYEPVDRRPETGIFARMGESATEASAEQESSDSAVFADLVAKMQRAVDRDVARRIELGPPVVIGDSQGVRYLSGAPTS